MIVPRPPLIIVFALLLLCAGAAHAQRAAAVRTIIELRESCVIGGPRPSIEQPACDGCLRQHQHQYRRHHLIPCAAKTLLAAYTATANLAIHQTHQTLIST